MDALLRIRRPGRGSTDHSGLSTGWGRPARRGAEACWLRQRCWGRAPLEVVNRPNRGAPAVDGEEEQVPMGGNDSLRVQASFGERRAERLKTGVLARSEEGFDSGKRWEARPICGFAAMRQLLEAQTVDKGCETAQVASLERPDRAKDGERVLAAESQGQEDIVAD
ncbi:MAG: hypothetical protein M1837_003599 [Sclerophora amabilis]|nr:MAG: hypothetical protein M1837_003599 [Sclerophora amabilis]